ncbi:MAG TPA: RimK/LysX family protein [Solimonas sp.]|nr:RimK/LysX family protein [Solimonas sp.]
MIRRWALAALAALLPLATLAQESCPPRYGWLERVRIETLARWMEVEAKLDTGADISSLHAADVELFEREGQNWLRFRINDEVLEQPVARRVRIRQKNGAEPQERWVVTLDLCIGQTALQADFSLADRSGFSTPVLLGRDVLERLGAVDPGQRYTAEPNCAAVQ